MNLSSYIKEIRKSGQRYFTLQQLMVDQSVSKNAALNAIYRLRGHGELISPARGLYVIVPPEHQPHGSIPAEELVPLVMKYLGVNYYVAFLTAGLFHGATHQKPAKFQVISDKRIKHPSTFGDVEIDFIYKKSMLSLPTQDFTVSTGYLKVATPELVALDLLEYPNHAGGLNHIATVFSELIENLDPVKLINLAKDIHAEYQLQRIGYILDHIDVMDEKNAEIITNALALFVKENKPAYLPLASEISKAGYPRCKKWRIIENSEIESDL
ncbi:MAG TPA: type IV toxin-antitoxin system AbiEi family antitoxin [Gammaproteobacteria bacterium]|nr:type IV toxin-antitoxin system AbiEi family antitoxin [Gammaproteobacteria bacterium]